MIDLFSAAAELQEFCDGEGWRICFIGGLAVQRWGEPRVTRDVDLTLLAGFNEEGAIIDRLLQRYTARLKDAREFALRHRVVLLQTVDGVGIDVSMGGLEFEKKAVDRASLFKFSSGAAIRTCSAEDLVVMKLFASRALDVRDAEGVVIRNGESLDWNYIESELRPLAEAKEDPEILKTLARLRELSRTQ